MTPRDAIGCPDPDDLSALFDGELEGAERERVAAHLAACADCAAALDRHAATSSLLRSLPKPTVSASAAREIALRASAASAAATGEARRGWLPLAAVLLVGILGGGAFVAAWRVARRELPTTAAALQEKAPAPRVGAKSSASKEALHAANASDSAAIEAESLRSVLAAQAGAAPETPPALSPSSPLAQVAGKDDLPRSNEAAPPPAKLTARPEPPPAPRGSADRLDDFAPSPPADVRTAPAEPALDAEYASASTLRDEIAPAARAEEVASDGPARQERDASLAEGKARVGQARADEAEAEADEDYGEARRRETASLRKPQAASPPGNAAASGLAAGARAEPAMPPARSATGLVLETPCALDAQGRLAIWAPKASRPATVATPLWVERLPAAIPPDARPVRLRLLAHLNGSVTVLIAEGRAEDVASVQAALAQAARQSFWCGGVNREAIVTAKYVPVRDAWSGQIVRSRPEQPPQDP